MRKLILLGFIAFGTIHAKAQTTAWDLTGNAGTNPATHFIGTTDDADIIFKRFNQRVGLLGKENVSFGFEALNPITTGGR